MNTQITTKLVSRCLGATLLGVAVLCGTTFAAEPSTRTVKYDDLNLNSDAGIAALYSRTHRASRQVCELMGDNSVDLVIRANEQKCETAAESQAIKNVHNEALFSFYMAKLGRPVPALAKNDVK